MGVRGLTKFIKEQRLRVKQDLHDCRIIIDGTNIMYFLYNDYGGVRHQYGGDYDVFDVKSREFFDTLRKCNIEAFVIFDGAHPADGRRFEVSRKRAAERLPKVADPFHERLFPILLEQAFYYVLEDMAVAHVTCYFEADEKIAALARRWNCPVLTNDSDFFVYDIPGGVFQLEGGALDVRNSTASHSGVSLCVEMFNISKLIQRYHLSHAQMVAVAATLVGNDVVDSEQFRDFYSKTRPQRNGGYLAGTLQWLSSIRSIDDAIQRVVACINNVNRRGLVTRMIQESIDSYSCSNISCSDIEKVLVPADVSAATTDKNIPVSCKGNPLPPWLLEGIQSCHLPSETLNVIILRKIVLHVQIEKLQAPSAQDCSKKIRSFFYNILLSVDPDRRGQRIEEYDREGTRIICKLIEIVKMSARVTLPSLDNIPKLTDEEKLQIFKAALYLDCDNQDSSKDGVYLRQENQVSNQDCVYLRQESLNRENPLVMIMIYWARNARPHIIHRKALVVCCLCLGAFDDLMTDDSHVASQQNLLKKFSHAPNITSFSASDWEVVHSFAQFQTCLKGAMYLGQLLLESSFSTLRPSRIYNGSFVYNLVQELKGLDRAGGVDLAIAKLLGEESVMAQQYININSIVDDFVSRAPDQGAAANRFDRLSVQDN